MRLAGRLCQSLAGRLDFEKREGALLVGLASSTYTALLLTSLPSLIALHASPHSLQSHAHFGAPMHRSSAPLLMMFLPCLTLRYAAKPSATIPAAVQES